MFADAVFLLVIAGLFLAAVELYTRAGSGIAQHPYRHVHGDTPGASLPSRMSSSADRDILRWSRGTR